MYSVMEFRAEMLPLLWTMLENKIIFRKQMTQLYKG